jgi:hypothetical protein
VLDVETRGRPVRDLYTGRTGMPGDAAEPSDGIRDPGHGARC